MPYRALGRTGEKLSLLGVRGTCIGRGAVMKMLPASCARRSTGGVNFVENSWDYGSGVCEYRMGKALQDGYRKKVFLASKVNGRTKGCAAWQLDESLRRRAAPRYKMQVV
jgi:predicted aldo/keto reductase-like oxidoreductase